MNTTTTTPAFAALASAALWANELTPRQAVEALRDLVGDDHINDAVVELVRHSIGFGEYSYAAELIEALRDLLP
jgi:hypothetical protein